MYHIVLDCVHCVHRVQGKMRIDDLKSIDVSKKYLARSEVADIHLT